MLAADKEQGNMREDREDEKLLRIFIKVPKSHSEEMIQEYFKVKSGTHFARIVMMITKLTFGSSSSKD